MTRDARLPVVIEAAYGAIDARKSPKIVRRLTSVPSEQLRKLLDEMNTRRVVAWPADFVACVRARCISWSPKNAQCKRINVTLDRKDVVELKALANRVGA